jgi:hypothetical protein
MEAIDQKYVHLSFVNLILVANVLKYGNSTIVNRFKLCRAHTFNTRPGETQAFVFRRPPPPFELPG